MHVPVIQLASKQLNIMPPKYESIIFLNTMQLEVYQKWIIIRSECSNCVSDHNRMKGKANIYTTHIFLGNVHLIARKVMSGIMSSYRSKLFVNLSFLNLSMSHTEAVA